MACERHLGGRSTTHTARATCGTAKQPRESKRLLEYERGDAPRRRGVSCRGAGALPADWHFGRRAAVRTATQIGAERLTVQARSRRLPFPGRDRKSTRLNSSHANISYAVFCLKKKKKE